MPTLKNTWTGGQYSLFRGLFGGVLASQFAQGTPFGLELPSGSHSPALLLPVLALAFATSIALAIGYRDRIAALGLATGWVLLMSVDAIRSNPGFVLLEGLLLIHALMPMKPFGAWDARGRLDPDGRWRMPNILFLSGWALLALGYVYLGTVHFMNTASLDGPGLWPGFLLLHLLTFNPGWIPSRHPPGHTTVFYDGGCGLCHQTIRILLAEDAAGQRFRFAPLESDLFRAARAKPGSGFADEDPIPDSVLVERPGERLLARSAGVLELGHQLGGYWRAASTILGWLPSAVLDSGYDFVARIRHRLFARPEDVCPILPPDLRGRFTH